MFDRMLKVIFLKMKETRKKVICERSLRRNTDIKDGTKGGGGAEGKMGTDRGWIRTRGSFATRD